jgi:hypothetical protein
LDFCVDNVTAWIFKDGAPSIAWLAVIYYGFISGRINATSIDPDLLGALAFYRSGASMQAKTF